MTDTLAIIARLLLYLAVTVAIGDLGAQRAEGTPWSARLAVHAQRRSLLAWLLTLVALLLLFGAQFAALELTFSRDDVAMLVRQTAWGQGWAVLMVGALLALFATVARASGTLRALLAVLFAGSLSGLGHAAADAMPIVARALDGVHVVGIGVWIGTLLCLGGVTSAASWQRFSRAASVAAPLVVLTGVGSAWRRLGAAPFAAIVTSDYGRELAAKLALVAIVLVLGLRHRRAVHVHRAPSVRGIRVELALALLVMVVTAVLTGTAPPGE
jgi:putative copper export protein